MTPDLHERIQQSNSPNRELDALAIVALTPRKATKDDLVYLSMPHKHDQCAPGTYWLNQRSGKSLHTAPPLTASLDACIALMEQVLPGWLWTLEFGGVDEKAGVQGFNGFFGTSAVETETTHPLLTHAILLAVIQAKGAQDG